MSVPKLKETTQPNADLDLRAAPDRLFKRARHGLGAGVYLGTDGVDVGLFDSLNDCCRVEVIAWVRGLECDRYRGIAEGVGAGEKNSSVVRLGRARGGREGPARGEGEGVQW